MGVLVDVFVELLIFSLSGRINPLRDLRLLCGEDVRHQEIVALHRKPAAGRNPEAVASTVHDLDAECSTLCLVLAVIASRAAHRTLNNPQ